MASAESRRPPSTSNEADEPLGPDGLIEAVRPSEAIVTTGTVTVPAAVTPAEPRALRIPLARRRTASIAFRPLRHPST